MDNFENMDIEPIVKDLYDALDGKVDEATIRKEVDTYINTYRIPVDSAKSGILKKLGNTRPANAFTGGQNVTKKIAELEGTEMNVTVVAKMVFVEKRTINAKGVEKTIISGIAGDDTGTTPFTIWSDSGEYEKGSVYTFRNAYTKKWRDQVQLNIGSRGKVEPNTEVTFDNVSRSAGSAAQEMDIGNITEQTKNCTVTGKVSEIASRVINVKGEEKTIWGGMMADSTGRIQFTAWKDFGLKDGEVICAKNAYIRAWKGIPQLNLGDNTEVERSDKDIGEIADGTTEKTVEDVVRIGGGLDISITGTIVDLRTGSGLIRRCPQCNRSVLSDECTIHGHIEPVMDLRLKATVDDGTGAISAVIGRAETEKITGITLEQAEEISKTKGDMGAVANKMASILILKKVTVKGNVMTDDFGPQMIVHSADISNVDVQSEAEKLYEEVEASM